MRLRWDGHVARVRKQRNVYKTLIGEPLGKRSVRKSRRKWKDNAKIDLWKVGYEDRRWMELA
jgi:hypothetical protein